LSNENVQIKLKNKGPDNECIKFETSSKGFKQRNQSNSYDTDTSQSVLKGKPVKQFWKGNKSNSFERTPVCW